MSNWFRRMFKSQEAPAEKPAPAPAPAVRGNLAAEARGAERRSCARVNLDLQVRLRFETADAMIASRTFDISRSGAFITIKDPRPRGTRVRLTVEVDETTIVLGGVVVRACDGKKTSRRGMGIQFTEITPQAADALERLLGPKGG